MCPPTNIVVKDHAYIKTASYMESHQLNSKRLTASYYFLIVNRLYPITLHILFMVLKKVACSV